VQGFDGKCCAICFDDEDCDVIELECGGYHRFHRQCVTSWLQASSSKGSSVCPMCRRRPKSEKQSQFSLDGVFQNTPDAGDADASGRSELPQERTSGNALLRPQNGTYENNPISSAANASATSSLDPATPRARSRRQSGVFENSPMPSPAHVSALSPSESISQYVRSPRVNGTFENNPSRSGTHASDAAPLVCTSECSQITRQRSIFESILGNNVAAASEESSFGQSRLPRRNETRASSENLPAMLDLEERRPRRRLRSPSSWISRQLPQ
jgi:hypothetical protein